MLDLRVDKVARFIALTYIIQLDKPRLSTDKVDLLNKCGTGLGL